ncbi:hypothetical protein FUAX_51830 (plasmid) [Fulvitalea axinellae]|uniref:HTH araC/xylS-type domain-containing protein n=1 Tax=Fulvitalea axinellae TaxID=1182444 RepID=A0AAU9CUM8_9BACT|nr:hypothetical protein FUAX_51830 [Fulvitalea axinellae]
MPITLNVKNMVCRHCIAAVRKALDELDIEYTEVNLGEIVLKRTLCHNGKLALCEKLESLGFELLEDAHSQTTERIKLAVIEALRSDNPEIIAPGKHASFLADKLKADYRQLSKIFSSVEGVTLEKYVIAQRVERAKEVLVYGQNTLSEIADLLGYRSVQHLSGQFRKVTGLSPSHFLKVKENKRMFLDQVTGKS